MRVERWTMPLMLSVPWQGSRSTAGTDPVTPTTANLPPSVRFLEKFSFIIRQFYIIIIAKLNFHKVLPCVALPCFCLMILLMLSMIFSVLWNRNYFFRFRFWFLILKSYRYGSGSGSGSGSYFWKVTVPAPAIYQDHKKQIFSWKILEP